MEIKTGLKQLCDSFVQSANTLPEPHNSFAAQLAVLTAHVGRIETKLDAEIKARAMGDKNLDSGLDVVVDEILALRQGTGAASRNAAAEHAASVAAANAQAASSGGRDASGEESNEESDPLEDMAAQVEAENAAELAAAMAINNTPPVKNGKPATEETT